MKVGETKRQLFGASKPVSVATKFGMRVVCPACKDKLDAEKVRNELIQYAELGVAAAVIIFILVMRLFS